MSIPQASFYYKKVDKNTLSPTLLSSLPQRRSEKILWNNKFLKVPLIEIILFGKKRWPLFLMESWTLNLNHTTFSFLYFGILWAYPPNFYWISKQWQQSEQPTRKKILPPQLLLSCNPCSHFEWELQTIRKIRYKILQPKAKKDHFILIFILHANKYIFEVLKF
jgi:hypothetical protein